jgi:hypothetical protein
MPAASHLNTAYVFLTTFLRYKCFVCKLATCAIFCDHSCCLLPCMQVPLHMCKAVAALLPNPFTYHIAVELLNHLPFLVQAASSVQHNNDAAGRSTTSLTLAINTQIAASGLLQQLPAALTTARQQLQQLNPLGWCGAPCHFCKRGLDSCKDLGLTNPGAHSPQHTLLEVCCCLVDFWPGSLGALGSSSMAPALLPAAKLALSSLQYVCRQAGQLHTPSSSTPPPALVDLGVAALHSGALMFAANEVTSAEGHPEESKLPQHTRELLSSPEMLSVLVAHFSADV